MIALLALLGGGLWYGHAQSNKRAAADALGAKAPENANAPTDGLISDDNTGMPTPTKAPEEIDLSPVKLAPAATPAEANPAVAQVAQTFGGEEVKLYFAEVAKEDQWVDGEAAADKERQRAKDEKTKERERWQERKE